MSEKLPKSWVEASISEVSQQIRGVSYKKHEARSEPESDHFPVLRANNIVDDKIDLNGLVYIPNLRIRDEQKIQLKDVVVAMSSGSKKVVGKTAQINSDWKGSFGTFCGVLRPLKNIDADYFAMFLKSDKYRKKISSLASGSNINNIKKDHFDIIKIPIPPLFEQKRIASKLAILLAKVDACKSRLEKVPEIIKRFRQSVLADAVSGKLTEDWREKHPGVETAEEMLKRIGKEREKRHKTECDMANTKGKKKPKKPENLNPIPLANVRNEVPNSWIHVTFRDISSTKHYAMTSGPFGSALGTKDYQMAGIPIVRGQNVQPAKFNNSNFVYITDKKANELKRSQAIPGDIVIVAVGAGVGNSAIVPSSIKHAVLSQNCNKFTVDDGLALNRYILAALQISIIRSQMDESTTDTARQFLSLTNLKRMVFPLPPFEEQKEIVKQVDKLFTIADNLEIHYQNAKAKVAKLSHSVLSKAFCGELVYQDPNDEPAELLLKRTQAEREALAANKKKGGRTAKKKSGRGKKTKPQKADSDSEPDPAVWLQLKTSVNEEKDRKVKSRKQPVAHINKRFEKTEVLQAFRKAIFRQADIDEYSLLRLVGQRLGVHRLSKQISQELESYIRTAIRRKIITHNGGGYDSATPTIHHCDDDYLIKVLRSVARKGYEYEREYLVAEVAEYLGFDRVSDALSERMKSIFRLALRRGELYRNSIYVGKV